MTITSLSELRQVWNATHDRSKQIKAPKKKVETRSCENCGQPMRKIGGTNVWMCDHASLEDKKLGEQTVQVFRKCGQVELV